MKRVRKAAILVVALLILAGCAAFFNSPPVANFTVNPTTGSAPLTVYVNATNSYDTDGRITSWRWSFGDGGSGYGETTSHRYAAPGTYIIRLTVTDNRGDVDTCYYSVVVTEPYPYSFSDPYKPYYPRTLYGAQKFIADARDEGPNAPYPHWQYMKNGYVQSPDFSEWCRTGDCDDYAVMIAAFLEEYWGYDTFIVLLDMGPGEDEHMVAFVYPPDELLNYAGCPDIPVIDSYGCRYYPVDWSRCPGWMWKKYWGTVDYSDTGYTHNVTTGEIVWLYRGEHLEWDKLVNLALSTYDERTSLPAPIPAEWSTADTSPGRFLGRDSQHEGK